MKKGLIIKKRKYSDGWIYFICPKGNENIELATIDVYFLDKVTSIFNIVNNTFGTKNYIKGLGQDLFEYIKIEAIKKGHKSIIAEWVDREDKGGDVGWKFFVKKNDFKLMTKEDYTRFNFTRDKHEGMDYILLLNNTV